MDLPANIADLARELGYTWPERESDQRKIDCLVLMARTAMHWRAEVESCGKGVYREKYYLHLKRRNDALAKKLRHVRQSAIEYKRGRDFDNLCRLTQDTKPCLS